MVTSASTASPADESWWRSRRSDPVIAMVYLVISLGGAWRIPVSHGNQHADALATAVCVAAAVGLVLRHINPRIMLALATIGVTIYGLRSYPGGPAYLALPLAVLFYGMQRPRKESYLATGVVIAICAAGMLSVTPVTEAGSLVGLAGWAIGAALVADVLRSRQERKEAAHRERREQEQRAQAQEQLWLARDLHDSVAHALTAIHVQSAIAARQVRTDPDRAEESLEAIRRTTSDALDELGTIVRSLRAPGEAPRLPSSSLADIGELVEQARRSGVDVTFECEDSAATSRVAVAVAVYRVVQESLTNVVRHAPGARATVTVRHVVGEGLLVRVVNTAATTAVRRHGGSGLGLVGMRERVEGSGGALEHGGVREGGYRVEARWEDS